MLLLQELEQLGLGESVNLHVCEIPVEYQAIQRLMPSLWEEHQPQVCKKALSKVPSDFHQPLWTSLSPLLSPLLHGGSVGS